MKGRDLGDYAIMSTLWGLSFAVVARVVHAFGWIGAASFRALVAAGVLFGLAALTKRRLDFSVGLVPFVVIGATTVAGGQLGLMYAIPRIGTAMAAIFVGCIPLFSMVIGQVWGIERITRWGKVGLVLGFVGIVLLVGFPAVPVTTGFIAGCVGSMSAVLAAAIGTNYAHARLGDVGSYEITAAAFLFGGLMILPFVLVVPIPTMPGPIDYAYLLFLGSMMSGLAYVLYFRLVARWGATKTITSEFFVTAIAVVVGALALHEHLSWVQLVGAVVIVLGCLLVLDLLPVTSGPTLQQEDLSKLGSEPQL
ncbi:MAG: DMT family transporter [Actinomycetes bacterium]